MSKATIPEEQDSYLKDMLHSAKRFLKKEGVLIKGESSLPDHKVVEALEVMGFVIGFIDGLGSLSGIDRVRRDHSIEKWTALGRQTALNELNSGNPVNTPLWSELNPN